MSLFDLDLVHVEAWGDDLKELSREHILSLLGQSAKNVDLSEHFPGGILVVKTVTNHLDGYFFPSTSLTSTDNLAEASSTTDLHELIIDLSVPPGFGQLGSATPLIRQIPCAIGVISTPISAWVQVA